MVRRGAAGLAAAAGDSSMTHRLVWRDYPAGLQVRLLGELQQQALPPLLTTLNSRAACCYVVNHVC